MRVLICTLAIILFVVATVKVDGTFDDMLDFFKEVFTTTAPLTVFIILSSIGLVFSVKIANFGRDNFDEVVSRRMRYRSSKVDLYDENLFYWLVNFSKCLITFSLVTLIIITLCKDIIMD
jgi:hypothetical protein